jgi:hypothetical protein
VEQRLINEVRIDQQLFERVSKRPIRIHEVVAFLDKLLGMLVRAQYLLKPKNVESVKALLYA